MPRSLADGKTKVAVLTTKPANPAAPTVTELAAGIDASCSILASDFNWSATDSDKVQEKPLCEKNNVNSLGAGNYNLGLTLFRFFDETTEMGDVTEDALFDAFKDKGTSTWIYVRTTAKDSNEAWEAADEVYLGGEVLNDTPQEPSDRGGFIKKRVPLEAQSMHDNILVVAGS